MAAVVAVAALQLLPSPDPLQRVVVVTATVKVEIAVAPQLSPLPQRHGQSPNPLQGCGSATRFRDCSTQKKIKKTCFHLVTWRPVARACI